MCDRRSPTGQRSEEPVVCCSSPEHMELFLQRMDFDCRPLQLHLCKLFRTIHVSGRNDLLLRIRPAELQCVIVDSEMTVGPQSFFPSCVREWK